MSKASAALIASSIVILGGAIAMGAHEISGQRTGVALPVGSILLFIGGFLFFTAWFVKE